MIATYLRAAHNQDLVQLIQWFSNKSEVKQWGGPSMPFPLNLPSLKKSIAWQQAKSYALVNQNNDLLGFAQILDRDGFKHIGRVATNPYLRNQGIGYLLLKKMILKQKKEHNLSLFVYKDNVAAIKLYRKLGFKTSQPATQRLDNCDFMVLNRS